MDSRLLIQRALGLHQQGQLDQAAELYGQILQQEPGNAPALQLLGVLRGQQGRNVEAIKLIEAALAIQPRDFGTLANYGQILAASGRPQDALDIFDKALAIKPDFFEALFNKAVALAQLKRFAQAVTSTTRRSPSGQSAGCFYIAAFLAVWDGCGRPGQL